MNHYELNVEYSHYFLLNSLHCELINTFMPIIIFQKLYVMVKNTVIVANVKYN